MIRVQKSVCILVCLAFGMQAAWGGEALDSKDLDAFWTEVSRTVVEGDFEGYKSTYHKDAILVSGFAKNSHPIQQALSGWEQGFIDTRAGNNLVTLEFRFTRRFRDEITAHETGMFYYTSTGEDGVLNEDLVHFEALLIKQDGWKMLMEYQKSGASRAEWDAAP